MTDRYWIIENVLAGSTGPNAALWDYEEIVNQGFKAVLSVNNGESVDGRWLAELGVNHAVIPMTHRAPPVPGDLELCVENLPLAIQFIKQNQQRGPVILHCRSGKDRTGLVGAAYLMHHHGLSAEEAIEAMLSIRSIAYTAVGWKDFAGEVLQVYAKTMCKTSPA